MPSRIARVSLRDYRSIGSCEVDLQPLTLLVGPNGSGKSNFLDSLRFLVHSMHAPLEQVVEARAGVRSILRKLPGGRTASSFAIGIGFDLADGTPGSYWVEVSDNADGAPIIALERCHVGKEFFSVTQGSVDSATASVPAFTGDRPALVSFGSMPEFAAAFNLIAGMTFYAPNPEQMRRPASLGSGKVLSRDGGNAADVLARLDRSHSGVVSRIREYLSLFNPEFSDVSVTETNDYRWLAFTPAGNPRSWRLNASDVSDGTLRAIAILLAIFQASTAKPRLTLVGLEEPENNLHPAAAGVLLEALLEASGEVPVIASTHSADLLDRKDVPDSALLTVALEDGKTVIGPVSDANKLLLRKRLYTAGELLRNNQLSSAETAQPG